MAMQRFGLASCVAAALCLAPQAAFSSDSGSRPVPLVAFDEPLLFTYGSWSDRVRTSKGKLQLRGKGLTNRGGGGVNLNADLSRFANDAMIVRVRLGEENETRELRVRLRDADGAWGLWRFSVGSLPHSRWIDVVAQGNATLEKPNSSDPDKGEVNLAQVRQVQLEADWEGPRTLDAEVKAVSLVPTSEIAAINERQSGLDQLRLEQEIAAVEHTSESPRVVHIGAVNDDLLEVVLQERWIEQQGYEEYVPEPGDEVREGGHRTPGWVNGELVDVAQKRELWRGSDGEARRIGLLAGGASGPSLLLRDEVLLGDELNLNLADRTEAYHLRSQEDPRYATATRPTAVYRKSKPNEKAMPDVGYTVRHRLYLRFPEPFREGRRYELTFAGVNTDDAVRVYVHDTRRSRSSAIHTNQAGYRPDDPHKKAFLSLWKGTGGAEVYPEIEAFEVIDREGDVALTGRVTEVMAADGTEILKEQKNHSQTAVYAMDFADLDQPGEYRIRIAGIGVSHPVRIAKDTWRRAFRASMHGFLTQRSGVDIGPTVTEYQRPRSLHPADGLPIYQSTTDETDAFSRDQQTWFEALVEGRTDATAPGAWGGYHDAGDFDRRGDHLWASYLHAELLDLFPEYFERLNLRLPGDESADDLPDLLNEVLWNVECFERLQHPDGGVGGGIEASAHPRKGEASWIDSLVWMTFAPDVYNSYTYAAVAARTARVAGKYDATLSDRLRESAVRAWEWAEANVAAVTAPKQQRRARDARAAAAAELLWLTNGSEYDAAFAESHRLDEPIDRSQHGAPFTYARLPNGVGDEALKRAARERVIAQADAAVAYGDGNAFGLTSPNRYIPLIGPVGAFTTPEMGTQVLPHAHHLTGDDRYLASAVRACDFSLGANPGNLVMTTGVGHNPIRNPLHFDSRYSRQPAPAGITVYGPFDRESLPRFTQNEEWGHTYILTERTTPPSRTWPTTESHFDVFLWPSLCEFTIAQNMGPTSYYWGYLAARNNL